MRPGRLYADIWAVVLGEFTYAILVGSPARGGLTLSLLRSVWTLTIAFCFNSSKYTAEDEPLGLLKQLLMGSFSLLVYVYGDGAIDSEHPIRRSTFTAFPWLLIHLPLSAGLLIGGHVSAILAAESAPERSHVQRDADLVSVTRGRRWLWGGGLGVGMLGMWIIAELWRDCDPPGRLLLPKQLRILPRLLAAIIYACLPLCSEEQLSNTALISTGAGISVFVVMWETIAGLDRGAGVFESWKGKVETFGTVVYRQKSAEMAAKTEQEAETKGLEVEE